MESLHWRRLLPLSLQCQTSDRKQLLKNDWKSHGNPEQRAQEWVLAQGMTHALHFLPFSFGTILKNHHSKRDLQIVLPRNVKPTTLCLTDHSIKNLSCRSWISLLQVLFLASFTFWFKYLFSGLKEYSSTLVLPLPAGNIVHYSTGIYRVYIVYTVVSLATAQTD